MIKASIRTLLLTFIGVFPLLALAAISTDAGSYDPPATVFYTSNDNTNSMVLFNGETMVCYSETGNAGTAISLATKCTSGGTFDGTVSGSYHLVQPNNEGCHGNPDTTYTECVSGNPTMSTADFTITGGGGGGSTSTANQISVVATHIGDSDYLEISNCTAVADLLGANVSIYIGTNSESLGDVQARAIAGGGGSQDFSQSGGVEHACDLSTDEGRTWTNGRRLFDNASYSGIYTAIADGTYYWVYSTNSGAGDSTYWSSFTVSGSSVVGNQGSDNYSHFIYTTPFHNETIASSTYPAFDVGGSVYISSDDFVDGMYLDIGFDNRYVDAVTGVNAIQAWNSAQAAVNTIHVPLSVGVNNISTTTVAGQIAQNEGIVTMSQRVMKPTWASTLPFFGSFFSSPDTLIATTTQFTLGSSTAAERVFNDTAGSYFEFLATGTTTAPILDCNPDFHFSLEKCITSLIIPKPILLDGLSKQFFGGVASKVPIGYITRFVQIFTFHAPVEPPPLDGCSSNSASVIV